MQLVSPKSTTSRRVGQLHQPLGLELLTCFSTSTMGTNLHLGTEARWTSFTKNQSESKHEAVGQSNRLLALFLFIDFFSFGSERKKHKQTRNTNIRYQLLLKWSKLKLYYSCSFFQLIITLAEKTGLNDIVAVQERWVLVLLLHPGSPVFFVCRLETGYMSGKRFGQVFHTYTYTLCTNFKLQSNPPHIDDPWDQPGWRPRPPATHEKGFQTTSTKHKQEVV